MTKEAMARIDALDLRLVKLKLAMSPDKGGYGWPEKETDEAIENYRTFLKEVYAYRTEKKRAARIDGAKAVRLSPDPLTDIVWHTHILFTEKYHEDCESLFGEYIHHRPVVDENESADSLPVEE